MTDVPIAARLIGACSNSYGLFFKTALVVIDTGCF
jgi:hypothetical protein